MKGWKQNFALPTKIFAFKNKIKTNVSEHSSLDSVIYLKQIENSFLKPNSNFYLPCFICISELISKQINKKKHGILIISGFKVHFPIFAAYRVFHAESHRIRRPVD